MEKIESERKEALWTKNFILVCFVALCTGVCMRMLDSNLTSFANDTWGSRTLGGYLTTVFNIGGIVMAFFSGRLVDVHGRRKCLMIASGVFTAATLLIAVWPVPAVALTARLIQGVAKGVMVVSTAAIVSDVIPRARMSEGMGYYGLGGTLSAAFGPMLALAITADKNYSRMFLLCAAAYLLAGVFGSQIKYENKQPKKEENKEEKPADDPRYKGVWKLIEKSALPAAFNYTVFFGGTAAILVFITIYGQEGLKLPGTKISLFYTVSAITMLIARLTTGKIADRRGALTVLIPGHCLVWIMYLCLLFWAPRSYAGFLVAGGIYGLCNAMVMPAFNAIAVVDSPKKRAGVANATFYFMMDFGVLIASAAFGPVIDKAVTPLAGYRQVFTISMCVCLVSLILAILLFNKKARERRKLKNHVE
ncbi:MAG: MFS transporter [Clostridia bacterium]|nr:MFS transporter [Clostridia bacterium]